MRACIDLDHLERRSRGMSSRLIGIKRPVGAGR